MKYRENLLMQDASEKTDQESQGKRPVKLCTRPVTGAQPAENIAPERGLLPRISGFRGNEEVHSYAL